MFSRTCPLAPHDLKLLSVGGALSRGAHRAAMLNTFLVCTGFSPTAAALRPAHAPSAAATSRSIPATMLAKRKAPGGGKAEVAYTVLEEDGSDVWRADDAVSAIRSGGVGVIPTDTGYDDARAQPSSDAYHRAAPP